MTPTRRLPRPRRATVPVAATVVVLVVWGVVARDTGTGWVQTIGALVAGVLVIGLLAPAIAVARTRCTVVRAPADAVAGAPVVVRVEVNRPVEVRPVEPPGSPVVTGRAGTVSVELRPEHRGVVTGCAVALASASPFGLMWWSRTVALELPQPLAVAPRTGRTGDALLAHAVVRDGVASVRGAGNEPRGVRPYERGDRRHLVHWPATAHTGALMVRDSERPAVRAVLVRAVLPEEPEAAEKEAERVMGMVAQLLGSGTPVQLATTEPDGEVVAPVDTVMSAGRRLALALPRFPASESGRPGRA